MKNSAVLLLLIAVATIGLAQGDHVPAYNASAPKAGEMLPVLPPDLRVGANFRFPYQAESYVLAAKIPAVISQLPCYCYCERAGHKSLHTCFESDHGAHCGICMKEVYYAYQQTKLKKTPAQIRDGIIKGDWKSIDLETVGSMN